MSNPTAVIKYHAWGNDYLVWLPDEPMDARLAIALCARHTGPGGDGVLSWRDPGPADHGVVIWNPDGSVAEKSGNGLRIYARWLVDDGRARASMRVWTGTAIVPMEVFPDRVVAEMGQASFAAIEVPVQPEVASTGNLIGRERSWQVVPVGLGNPHCVIFVDDPDAVDWQAWGREIEVHPAFPNRVNVQVAAVSGAGLDVRIHERGAGPTTASGSSSCAVAAAAVHTGRLAPGRIEVRMTGGTASVVVREDLSLRLEGPIERVGRFLLDDAWLRRRRRPPG